jgi:adenylosuccinate lyase
MSTDTVDVMQQLVMTGAVDVVLNDIVEVMQELVLNPTSSKR